MKKKNIYVTQPVLPELGDFLPYLEDIWQSKWLTNNGKNLQMLEEELSRYLGVENLVLFSNGTLALIIAFHALGISGEVITTPYSFVATSHALWWNKLTPVFVDIEPDSGNMDPEKVKKAISPATSAILPVHVYGTPCKNEQISQIAHENNLKLIYDAAHAFGVKMNGNSVLTWGHLSILSFHATKTFSTLEGGAIICQDKQMKQQLCDLRNFGFRDELTIVAPGINAKMNEIQAAFGRATLHLMKEALLRRRKITGIYRNMLKNIPGLRFFNDVDNVDLNYSYFPVFIDGEEFGITRDELYRLLKDNNIHARRYFYPLISNIEIYNSLPSAKPENLPVANKLANQVLCLPLYDKLEPPEAEYISGLVKTSKRN